MADPQIQQLSLELGSLTRVLRDMIDASSRTVAAQQANYQALIDQKVELEEFKKGLAGGRALTKQQNALAQEAIKLKRQEQAAAKEYHRLQRDAHAISKRSKATEEQKARATQQANAALQRWQAAQGATNNAVSALNNSFQGLVKGTKLTNAALVWFGATLRAQASQLLAQNQANNGVVEGTNSLASALWEQQNTALKYRLTGEEFAKITAANRQVINAMGGSKAAFSTLSPTIDRLRILSGDSAEGLRLASEAATEFARKGIRPTQAAMNRYTDDVVQLQRQTGMGTREAMAYFNDIASDADSIDILRSARKEEREAILQSQRALVQQSIAAGMSAEQAKEAAKMLSKMTAAKPLDRLKQAAKVRALSGAMGIAGGDAAAQAIIAGKRATAEQKLALQRFSENAANAMDQAAGQGLGTELFATTLFEKLDLEQYYGKNSAFSTTLGDTMKPAFADLSKVYVDASKDATAQTVGQLIGIYEQMKILISGAHWGGVVAAGVTAIAGMLMGGKLASFAGNVASKAMNAGKGLFGASKAAGGVAGAAEGVGTAAATAGRAAGAAEGIGTAAATAGKAAGAAAPAAAAGSTALSKLATAGKVAGVAGSALDVGLGVRDLMQGKAQTEMSGWDYLSPMRWGMYAGDKINKGAESLMSGQSIGSKLYDMIHGDEVAKLTAAPPTSPGSKKATEASAVAADAAKKTADASNDIKAATMQSADSLAAQVKKLDASNDFLKRIADMTEKQLDLAERQLVALTMTEKERTASANKTNLRRDSKFGAQYQYV